MRDNISMESQTVASANPLKIPQVGDVITVTGTTNFSSISHADNEAWRGRKITLVFTDILRITEGAKSSD